MPAVTVRKALYRYSLKKGGIDVDKRDVEGNTPLYHACLKGFRDIVNLLLDSDADVSIANNCSETPLHAVARNGNKEIIVNLHWILNLLKAKQDVLTMVSR